MGRGLPAQLEAQILTEVMSSLERGRAVRRVMIASSSVILAATLGLIAFGFGVTGIFPLAVIIVMTSLCVIWAIMSVSASLNAQFDQLATIIVYYADRENRGSGDV
jgi:hypothetical protein